MVWEDTLIHLGQARAGKLVVPSTLGATPVLGYFLKTPIKTPTWEASFLLASIGCVLAWRPRNDQVH